MVTEEVMMITMVAAVDMAEVVDSEVDSEEVTMITMATVEDMAEVVDSEADLGEVLVVVMVTITEEEAIAEAVIIILHLVVVEEVSEAGMMTTMEVAEEATAEEAVLEEAALEVDMITTAVAAADMGEVLEAVTTMAEVEATGAVA